MRMMMPDFMLLRQKRKENNLKLVDVAKKLGLETANAYWRIERGLTRLSAARMMKLCELLGLEPTEVLRKK